MILAYCLFVLLAFALANRRVRLVIAGLFVVLTLVLPPSLVVENEGLALEEINRIFLPGRPSTEPLPRWLDLFSIFVFFLPSIVLSTGVIVSAVSFASGTQLYQDRARARAAGTFELPVLRKKDDRYAGLSLVLSGLVLAVSLYNLYWLIVLDKTTDSVGVIWLVFTAPAVILSLGLLLLHLRQMATLSGLFYAILVPVSFIIVFLSAGNVDYRALTEARAERISRAIEAYHDREGRYPESLGQLTPRYLLRLPRPVIINGQDWCYEGHEDGYILGYVDREHWSSPELFGHMYSSGGFEMDLPVLCESEILALQDMRGW